MVNKNILLSRVNDKFKLLTLHSIVNECFINGLPIKKEEITPEEKKDLTKYSYKVLKTVGGFSALESAIDNPKLTFKQRMKLADIDHLCTSFALEAAKRVVSDVDCKDPSTKLDDVIDKASFTESEYKQFASKAHAIGLEEMSEIIQKKTLAVIKDEQEQYEKEEALDTELKDALSESKDFADTTTEAYMDIFLGKNDPRKHVTVFSRLQDVSMEMMNIVKIADDDVMPLVDKVTFEAFTDDLKISNIDFNGWMESYGQVSNEEVCNIPEENKPKIATLVSIIVYTIMETLKTMNVYCPSYENIRSFVSKPMESAKVAALNKDELFTKAEEKLTADSKLDFSKLESSRLTNSLVELKKMSQMAQESLVTNPSDQRAIDIVNRVEEHVERINEVLHARESSMRAKANESFSYYDNLYREGDIAQFNKINNMFGKNPNVKEIRLNVNPDNPSSIVDVTCANESGQVINSSFMRISYAVESSQYLDYLKDRYDNSKLKESEKPVVMVFNDGSGRRIEL